jgi:hypothetical protein
VSADRIVQIATILVVIYVGWHPRSQLRTLKSSVDAQKATIGNAVATPGMVCCAALSAAAVDYNDLDQMQDMHNNGSV